MSPPRVGLPPKGTGLQRARLADEVAIVTGAGQGIGREVAILFAREGAAVTCADIVEANAQRTADEITKAGGKALGIHTDVSKSKDVSLMVRSTLDTFARVSILVNNAAIFPRKPGMTFENLAEEEWDRVIAVNLKGAFLCSRESINAMKKNGRGSIVIMSSSAAFTGISNGAHYAASKAGLLGLCKSLALALAPSAIRVNCIAPGLTDTAQPRVVYSEEQLADAGRRVPMGRIGTPKDIASAALFLASSESEYMTGQTLHVNGGSLLW